MENTLQIVILAKQPCKILVCVKVENIQLITIPNAGRGLFLKAQPLASCRPIVIPEGHTLCYYSRRTIQGPNNLATRDYYIQVGAKHFDASVFTGDNMGRFINQGGLLEGLKTMCRESAKQGESMHEGVIREEVNKHVNFNSSTFIPHLKLLLEKLCV